MLDLLSALILGVVEGFTEFLPISSTAHLILAGRLLGIPQSEFAKTFEIAIQSGAILAVVVLYFRRFLEWRVLSKIAAAFLPTGALGLILYHIIKTHLFGSLEVILWSLGLGGIALILFERFFREKPGAAGIDGITYPHAFAIGLFQSVAMIPGVSRAAATIVGGMFLGLSRTAIVEFSFLLAVPTMLAATGLDLLQNYRQFTPDQFGILFAGMTTSFITAVISIKLLLGYIRKHSFTAFGIYRILLVILFFIFFF